MSKSDISAQIQIKRVYEEPLTEDGYRILIDRIWPRGVTKAQAAIDEWMKEITPSSALRKWFGHRPEHFEEFAEKYVRELEQNPRCWQLADRICEIALDRTVTLVYAAKDPVYNHAIVLQKWLRSRFV